jgi:hypothetical protein
MVFIKIPSLIFLIHFLFLNSIFFKLKLVSYIWIQMQQTKKTLAWDAYFYIYLFSICLLYFS